MNLYNTSFHKNLKHYSFFFKYYLWQIINNPYSLFMLYLLYNLYIQYIILHNPIYFENIEKINEQIITTVPEPIAQKDEKELPVFEDEDILSEMEKRLIQEIVTSMEIKKQGEIWEYYDDGVLGSETSIEIPIDIMTIFNLNIETVKDILSQYKIHKDIANDNNDILFILNFIEKTMPQELLNHSSANYKENIELYFDRFSWITNTLPINMQKEAFYELDSLKKAVFLYNQYLLDETVIKNITFDYFR